MKAHIRVGPGEWDWFPLIEIQPAQMDELLDRSYRGHQLEGYPVAFDSGKRLWPKPLPDVVVEFDP